MSSTGVFRALRHSDYRRYTIGHALSMLGTWMHNVAQAWLVYRLTGSSLMLGIVSFTALIPVLLFGLIGGVAADRLPRRRLFLGLQYLAMFQAAVLGLLTLVGWISVWHILVLSFLLGLVQAFEMPARHSMVADLVPRADLPNAIAINSGLFNSARFAGPALAGWLILLIGEGWLFLLNALSFGVMVWALRGMQPLPEQARPVTGPAHMHLWEGLRHAWHDRPLRGALLMLAGVGLFAVPYLVLMPVFTREVFAGGAETLGYLLGAAGAGAMIGAFMLARRRTHDNLPAVIGGVGVVCGLALAVFSQLSHLGVALVLLVIIGFCLSTTVASINTFIQMQVPDELRGRVMSLFSVIFMGLAPIGNLAIGALAQVLGAPGAVLLFALLFCVAAAWFVWRQLRVARA